MGTQVSYKKRVYFVIYDPRYTGFTRAYINFKEYLDVLDFRNKFDGYTFHDMQGKEYTAVVELAPCQLVPKVSKMP